MCVLDQCNTNEDMGGIDKGDGDEEEKIANDCEEREDVTMDENIEEIPRKEPESGMGISKVFEIPITKGTWIGLGDIKGIHLLWSFTL